MPDLRAIAALPFHDPDGVVIAHFQRAFPACRGLFARAVVSLSHLTCARQPELADWFTVNPFFEVLRPPPEAGVGPQFGALFRRAASLAHPEQPVHLCFPDRVAYALLSEHRADFLRDIQSVRALDTPLIFARSAAAWASHPPTYSQLERSISLVGQALLGRELDFAWCYLAAVGAELRHMTNGLDESGIWLMGEMVLRVYERVQSREADWLAWEDAFILGRDPAELRREREASPTELHLSLTQTRRYMGDSAFSAWE